MTAGCRHAQVLDAWRVSSGANSNSSRSITPDTNPSCVSTFQFAIDVQHLASEFLNDDRVEIAFNVVERSIRPLALTGMIALFADPTMELTAEPFIASLIDTCKLIGVEPQTYLTDVIIRVVAGHTTAVSTSPCPEPTQPGSPLKPRLRIEFNG